MHRPHRLKNALFACVLALFVITIAGIVAETLLRWQERAQIRSMERHEGEGGVIKSDVPGLNYTLNPGYRMGDIQFSSLGFNMPERPLAKRAGLRRICFVGDSVTQGVGTDRTAEAYPNVIHDLLAQRCPSLDLETWNCGVGGYNAEQVRLLMEHELPRVQPDLVIYGFNFNDYWDANRYFFGQPGLLPDQQAPAARGGWMDRLKKSRVILRVRDFYNEVGYRARGYWPVYVDHKIDYPSWTGMKQTIRRMAHECRARGVGFAVLVLPNEQFLHVPLSRNLAYDDICRFLEESGIPYHPLLPALHLHRDSAIYKKDGNHMTALGNRLVAEDVAPWLCEQAPLLMQRNAP